MIAEMPASVLRSTVNGLPSLFDLSFPLFVLLLGIFFFFFFAFFLLRVWEARGALLLAKAHTS
jgi:hypothetical protein